MRREWILALLLAASPAVLAADSGAVCIAKVPSATAGQKSLYNATASPAAYDFSIRIGDRPAVSSSHDASVLVDGLATSRPQRVSIQRNGKPFAAFTLRFADYKSDQVCLWFGPLYESWSVWPMSQSKGKCACPGIAAHAAPTQDKLESAVSDSQAAMDAVARDIADWHNMEHPSCPMKGVVTATVRSRDSASSEETWTIHACEGKQFQYRVRILFSAGRGFSTSVGNADGSPLKLDASP